MTLRCIKCNRWHNLPPRTGIPLKQLKCLVNGCAGVYERVVFTILKGQDPNQPGRTWKDIKGGQLFDAYRNNEGKYFTLNQPDYKIGVFTPVVGEYEQWKTIRK